MMNSQSDIAVIRVIEVNIRFPITTLHQGIIQIANSSDIMQRRRRVGNSIDGHGGGKYPTLKSRCKSRNGNYTAFYR